MMAAETKHTVYEGAELQSFRFYLQYSGEHTAVLRVLQKHLPGEFQRIAADKNSLGVLGVGSGGGELDVEMLSLLLSAFPTLSITVDIVEASAELVANFKALVAKSDNLQKIPFTWHFMMSQEYRKQVNNAKKYDFIHMIQMIYFVDDLTETIRFYHSILKKNGTLLIIIEKTTSGWDILWRTFSKELCTEACPVYRSSDDVVAAVKTLGLKYVEHIIPNKFNITECFDPNSETGRCLLRFLTGAEFASFTPQIRSDILNLLRGKCSTEKEGKIIFNSCLSCIFVYA
ncbi:histamine N-methyltransferase-like [Syngnathoides biaculeatus]|uniref:histamine N-methyltransferase-like n=1 Tax=Syngnathoides biaculeatus TaxID=300417 RepID=UPI002ADDC13E|nr:histamine N-methyltransferase-like [Syngnathoides biaculeatus]XP_061698486.1 histamine N-methyltransferase-like [Syngnathoides biaculeatus]XP_061698488.1 histamine N-methyltransferase-like [Syngnathoides biaculeatus]